MFECGVVVVVVSVVIGGVAVAVGAVGGDRRRISTVLLFSYFIIFTFDKTHARELCLQYSIISRYFCKRGDHGIAPL